MVSESIIESILKVKHKLFLVKSKSKARVATIEKLGADRGSDFNQIKIHTL